MKDNRYGRAYRNGLPMTVWVAQLWDKLKKKFPNLILTQGSPSGAAASAGTHSGEAAIDFYLNGHDWKAVLRYAFEIGFFGWFRPALAGVWKAHCHLGVRGHKFMHAALKAQQVSWTKLRNGLKGNGPDVFTWRPANFKKAAPFDLPKPPPVKTRTTDITVTTFNVRGKTSGFPVRVPVIDARVRKYRPHVAVFQELPPGLKKRTLLSRALARTKVTPSSWKMTVQYANKVQYLLRSKNGWKRVKSKKYRLGNDRHGNAVLYRHANTGAELVVATGHPSWEHNAGRNRAEEARNLVSFLRRDFRGLPWLIALDANDSHKSTKTRPVDSSGEVFKDAGLHDLSFDPTNAGKRNRPFNTAHQNRAESPRSGIHIDRFWGTAELHGLTWTNDVHNGRRGSDHWLVAMTIRLTHPIKK